MAYEAQHLLCDTQVLVQRPTLVLVRDGLKQLRPQHATTVLVGPPGTLVAMRSGSHVMTERHGADRPYASWIVSVDRTFLREVAGVPASVLPGPHVVTTDTSAALQTRFADLPEGLAAATSAAERQFVLRALLVDAMRDSAVRQWAFREVIDWGHAVEERLRGVVSAHCYAPLQVAELASLCAMSVSTFKRHFKKVYGSAPAQWLTEVRLRHARSMLRHSDRSVREIGEASGYRDVSTFIRAFRRAFGTTPNGYRRA